MKSKIKYFLVVILLPFLLEITYAQDFIGEYEVYKANEEIYLEAGAEDIKVNSNVIIVEYKEGISEPNIQSFEVSKNLELKSVVNKYYIYNIPNYADYITYCQDIKQSAIVGVYRSFSIFYTNKRA